MVGSDHWRLDDGAVRYVRGLQGGLFDGRDRESVRAWRRDEIREGDFGCVRYLTPTLRERAGDM